MPTTHSAAAKLTVEDEIELPVEEVAERLGLPAAMLIRRIEAGDIPARRVDDEQGAHYSVRIGDLGTSSRAIMPQVAYAEAVERVEIEPEPEPVEDITEAVPPPAKATVELAPFDRDMESPRAELSAMSLDPRELVAGLLDRWERTLEQRIYAEQRQRFEAELTNRQAKVKQLQLELEAVRAEHAAALAEKERLLAEKMHELIDRERELDAARNQPKRGWLFRR
jgi:hypothetical protein